MRPPPLIHSFQGERTPQALNSYLPGHLLYASEVEEDRIFSGPSITWATFDPTGNFLLCNMGGEQVRGIEKYNLFYELCNGSYLVAMKLLFLLYYKQAMTLSGEYIMISGQHYQTFRATPVYKYNTAFKYL